MELLLPLLAIFAALVGLTTVALLRSDTIKRLRRLDNTPIREAREGKTVKVSGIVSADEVLHAPYTNRPCVYYRLEVRQSKLDFEAIRNFAEERCDFRVEDESGVADVLVERAIFHIVCDFVELDRASRLSPRARDLAREHQWPVADIAQVEICEGIVAPGESIDVVGKATREPAKRPARDERGYRDAPDTVLVFSAGALIMGPDREPIWIGEQTPR